MNLPCEDIKEPKWEPPKATYKDTIPLIFQALEEKFNEPKFVDIMKKCFVDVGLVQTFDRYGHLLIYRDFKILIAKFMVFSNCKIQNSMMKIMKVTVLKVG